MLSQCRLVAICPREVPRRQSVTVFISPLQTARRSGISVFELAHKANCQFLKEMLTGHHHPLYPVIQSTCKRKLRPVG